MRRLLIAVTLGVVTVPPVWADGQNRIVSVVRLESQRPEREREQRRNNDRETQTERFTRTVNIGTDGELDVANISGDIIVTRGGGTSATIEVTKNGRGATPDEAREAMDLVAVDIVERGTRVEIRTRYPDSNVMRQRNRRNVNVEVSFNITAPQNTRIVAKSISGNLSVTSISGGLVLESVSGTVRIANAGRTVAAKSISGNVEAIDTKLEGSLDAGSISGAVKILRTNAQGLKLNSISGEIVIEDVTCERIAAQSISAAVQFAGDFQPNGRYEFTSHSGQVRVAIGGKTGFQLEATSFSGNINTELPLTIQGQGRGRFQRTVRGSYGNGSAIVELTTFSGSVTITKR